VRVTLTLWRPASPHNIQFVPHREQPVLVLISQSYAATHVIGCLLWNNEKFKWLEEMFCFRCCSWSYVYYPQGYKISLLKIIFMGQIGLLIFYITQGSTGHSHGLYVQESFPSLCRWWGNVFKCRDLYCAILMEKKNTNIFGISFWY